MSPSGDPLADALRRWFGHAGFRDGQREPVEAVLRGRDAVVVMPTGSGKSLCYQLLAMLLPGTTLVVSPLIALMQDQVARLERRGIPAVFLNSTLPPGELEARQDAMARGAFKLVYVAPERFRNPAFRRALAAAPVSLLTVDEAHCISQWGHDFRPDYLALSAVADAFPAARVLAVTATATPEVRDDIRRQLHLGQGTRPEPFVQVQGFARPNLHLAVTPAPRAAEKLRVLARIVKKWRRGIVYAATRKHAENAFADLSALGAGQLGESTPLLYHAGLPDDERSRVLGEFLRAKYPVVVATNAFGMGVDRADIRFVVHWDIPGSIEAFYQEVGRAGRDGMPSRCELLFGYADVRTQLYFIEGANPRWPVAAGVLAEIARLAPGGGAADLDAAALARQLETNPIAVETAAKVLARLGALRLSPSPFRGLLRAELQPPLDLPALEGAFAAREPKRVRDEARLRAMLGYCDTPGCRHRFILNYFGEETLADVCGGCDRCGAKVPPPPLDDAKWLVVQKALSCVGRLRGGQPAEVAADVLRGVESPAVRRAGLREVSTWGLLAGIPRNGLLALFEALVRAGCATRSPPPEEHLRLTPKGLRVARREEPDFTLRWPVSPVSGAKDSARQGKNARSRKPRAAKSAPETPRKPRRRRFGDLPD